MHPADPDDGNETIHETGMDGGSGMTSLPKAFTERMGRQLGDELPDFLLAMDKPPERGIRMNPEKPFDGAEEYTAGGRIPWAENGYFLSPESTAGSTVFHEAGAFYLQEPAAMLPAEAETGSIWVVAVED